MNYLDDVPFRTFSNIEDDAVREANLVHSPEFDMPNCAEILTDTLHDFSLEKRVLYWIGSASWQDTPWCKVTTDVIPTAPPCWLLLVDSKESSPEETSNSTEEASPVQGCVNLAGDNEAQPIARMNGDPYPEEEEEPKGEESSSATSAESNRKVPPVSEAKHVPGTLARFFSLPQPKPRISPDLSAVSLEADCLKPSLTKQSQSMQLFNNVKNELERAKGKLSAFLRPLSHSLTESSLVSRAFSFHQRSQNNRDLRNRSASESSSAGTVKSTPMPTPCGTPKHLISAGLISPTQKHKPTVASPSPYACLPPSPEAQPSLGSHGTPPDSTADLLSALSQEERDLIEPVLALGYPIRRIILALQKTGQQSLGQFLGYLSACDKLLKQGYEEAQVEEAMEMFQNSEKAAEFLHLLAQFNDMGFQQSDIKEVLLLCENQGDNALEELMTRTQ